jgi:hypothetical protein
MRAFVSCVSKKHGKIKANISNINENSLEETFNVWKHQSKGTTPAADVYKGTQWNLIKNLSTKIPTSVISSGYGIIDLKTPIVPYSITFSSAYVENSHLLVPKYDLTQKEANKKWFNMFGDYSNLWDTDEVLIFTVNPLYLNVLDLPKKDNIIVLSDYRLGRLAKWLGSGANNLSVNFANYLVDNYPNISGNKELKNFVDYLDKRYGKDLYKKRQKCDDKFILDWINKGNSLKKLRDAGYSCSKQRFTYLKTQNNVEETIN